MLLISLRIILQVIICLPDSRGDCAYNRLFSCNDSAVTGCIGGIVGLWLSYCLTIGIVDGLCIHLDVYLLNLTAEKKLSAREVLMKYSYQSSDSHA